MEQSNQRVTYDHVATACQALIDAGEKITVRRVQAEVGGSNTTILNYLRAWQDKQRAASVNVADGLLTDEVRAALVHWVQARELHAKADAERRAAEIDELYTAAEGGWERAEAQNEALKEQLAEAQARLEQTERGHAEAMAVAEARLAEADKQLVELKDRLAVEQRHAEQARTAAAESKIKADTASDAVKALGTQNSTLQKELRELHARTTQIEQQAAVCEERVKNREKELTAARGRVELLERQHAEESSAVKNRQAEADKTIAEMQKRAVTAERQAAVVEERTQGRDESLKEARRELEEHRKLSQDLRSRLDTADKDLAKTQQQLAVCQSEREAQAPPPEKKR